MIKQSITSAQRAAFIDDLRRICEKHGLYLGQWSGHHAIWPIGANGEDVLENFNNILEELREDD